MTARRLRPDDLDVFAQGLAAAVHDDQPGLEDALHRSQIRTDPVAAARVLAVAWIATVQLLDVAAAAEDRTSAELLPEFLAEFRAVFEADR